MAGSKSEMGKTLQKLINLEDIPIEYGGKCDFVSLRDKFGPEAVPTTSEDFYGNLGKQHEGARYCSEIEVSLADYVRRLNENKPLPRPPKLAWDREDVIIGKDKYLETYEGGWMDQESQLHLPIEDWDPQGWPGMLFRK